MSVKAREFIDFWVENSVHAVEELGEIGGDQDVGALTRRCIGMATSQGISEADMVAEVGDIANYIQEKLLRVNQIEKNRRAGQ